MPVPMTFDEIIASALVIAVAVCFGWFAWSAFMALADEERNNAQKGKRR